MAIIVPAILEDTLEALQRRTGEILKIPYVHRIQVDFSDGLFTPRKTFALSDMDVLNPAYFWEAHLMVEKPEQYFFDAKIAGFNLIIFHYEAVHDRSELEKCVQELRNFKIAAGLAITPKTEVSEIFDCLHLFDQIVILGGKPGYQGQQLMPEIFAKIEKLKKHRKDVKIEIDIGVKLDNIRKLSEAGAELFVVGSALFDRGPENNLTPLQNFEKLQTEIKNL